jgi:hypothetical protein
LTPAITHVVAWTFVGPVVARLIKPGRIPASKA